MTILLELYTGVLFDIFTAVILLGSYYFWPSALGSTSVKLGMQVQ